MIAARDADALSGLLADDFEAVSHPNGAVYGREGPLLAWRSALAAHDTAFAFEPLGALGDSLALCRQHWSWAGLADGTLDVGAVAYEILILVEVNARGQARRGEAFAADRLGDAVVRLYERYAELLPEGPERARAAATARAAAALGGPIDLARFAAAFAPAIEFSDHWTIGLPPVRGAPALLTVLGSLLETAPDAANRIDDVLALRSDAFLVRLTNHGTLRVGGGAYERPSLMLWTFGGDGLVTRSEQFDVGREEQALARFDALTAARPRLPVRRRVQSNAATKSAAALAAAIAARDLDAAAALFTADMHTVHHPTGLVYDREGGLASLRPLLEAPDARWEIEPIAALGDSLALCRQWVSASAIGRGRFDVGAYEQRFLVLVETGPDGRNTRAEMFAADKLGGALLRLCERHAELLPEGRARGDGRADSGSRERAHRR